MFIHRCIHVCKLLQEQVGGDILSCPPPPMLCTCHLPLINAVAGGEVRDSRRAPLIHVHILTREVDMQSSHKNMDGFVSPLL